MILIEIIMYVEYIHNDRSFVINIEWSVNSTYNLRVIKLNSVVISARVMVSCLVSHILNLIVILCLVQNVTYKLDLIMSLRRRSNSRESTMSISSLDYQRLLMSPRGFKRAFFRFLMSDDWVAGRLMPRYSTSPRPYNRTSPASCRLFSNINCVILLFNIIQCNIFI